MMINILVGATIFAIWAVTLFFGKSLGISVLLFVVPITYFLIYILEKNNKVENKKAKILIIPIALLSSTYFIYNNSFFNILNILVIPMLIIFMIFELLDEKLNLNFDLISKIIDMATSPFSFFGEAFEKSRQAIEEKFKIRSTRKEKKQKQIGRAIFITVPIVLFIIFLLSSADETFGMVFEYIIRTIQLTISKIQLSVIVVKIIYVIVAFIYLLGAFYFISEKYTKDEDEKKEIKEVKDSFTIKMILGSLNVIYFIFCIIQLKALFIGDASINYSEYARQGFFQLMIVSLINLVMVLIAKKRDNKNKYIIVMCLMMVVFTFIILISSAYRMYLYENAYGYTLLRLLVYCILFTEGVLLIPTSLYILSKKINLAKTYFRIVLIVYLCMNFANFDNIIARRNVDRYMDTGKIDSYYLYDEMGTDAIEEIMRLLELNDSDNTKKMVTDFLKSTYNKLSEEQMDFRDFNISKIRAKKLIEEKYITGYKK